MLVLRMVNRIPETMLLNGNFEFLKVRLFINKLELFWHGDARC